MSPSFDRMHPVFAVAFFSVTSFIFWCKLFTPLLASISSHCVLIQCSFASLHPFSLVCLVLYVSRWIAVFLCFSLIALVSPSSRSSGGFSPLITLTLLPPVTVVFSVKCQLRSGRIFRVFEFVSSSWPSGNFSLVGYFMLRRLEITLF